jgi:hypothetical protein
MIEFAEGEIDGEEGFVVGASVSSFDLVGAVKVNNPGVVVKDCKVACVLAGATAPVTADYVSVFTMGPYQQATLAVGNVTVTIV